MSIKAKRIFAKNNKKDIASTLQITLMYFKIVFEKKRSLARLAKMQLRGDLIEIYPMMHGVEKVVPRTFSSFYTV